jgi:hypothetical protein
LGVEAAFLPGFSFGFNAVWIRDYLHNTTACSQIYHNHEAQSKVNNWRVVAQFRGCMPAGSNEPTHPSVVKALVPIRTSVMREFYKNRSAVVSKLAGVGSSFRLHRFSRIKFPIYVGIGPQTTFMQDAILASIDSTRRARDGK